ncbi:MAG: class I SAM-dependent methyltransferase [Candidatus Sericytochromatia bacterium]|nr:class I SAM-dependent methyltransferase [Candidatus Tanganyikabacteria bacterium]
MADSQPFPDLGSRIQHLQRTWDIRAIQAGPAGPAGLLKGSLRWAFRKGLGPPLDMQADLNWSLVAALSAVEEGLRALADGKGDRAELDAQAVRLEGLRHDLERRWQDFQTERDRKHQDHQEFRDDIARLTAEVTLLRDVLAKAEARAAAEGRQFERLAALDAAGLLLRLERLERRERPQAQPALAPAAAAEPAGMIPAFDYFKFEARFRGPRDEIRRRHEPYVAYFAAGGPVLDVGFGRGEFLEALRDAGIAHRGVDSESDMVAHCRDLGLDVVHGMAHDYLAGLADDSLGGVFLGQVVEHMSPAALQGLLELCAAKIRPGGAVVAETPNPVCPVALANFYIDPTHVRPVHPELFRFMAEEAGFGDVEFRYTSPLGDRPDPLVTRVAQAEGTDRYMDYALIGRIPAGGTL